MVPGRKRFPEIWPQASRNLGQGQTLEYGTDTHPRFQTSMCLRHLLAQLLQTMCLRVRRRFDDPGDAPGFSRGRLISCDACLPPTGR